MRRKAHLQHLQVGEWGVWTLRFLKGNPKNPGQDPHANLQLGPVFQDHVPRGVAGGEEEGAAAPRRVLPGLEEAASGGAHL